jgi:hypothetical protein
MNIPEINLQVLKDLASDIWDDLGRTRLAPVAVGLGLALLVITAVAFRPGGEVSIAAGSTVIPTAPREDDVSFTVPSEEPMQLSDIELSSPRDPFRSLGGLAGDEQTLLAAGSEIVDSVMGSGSSTGSGLSPEGASSLMPLDDLSGTPTTSPTTSPTTTSADPQAEFNGADDEDTSGDDPAPVSDYSYTADVQFGRVDDLKRYATVQRLGLIPSRKLPLIMFLGVASDHETAVFMVDSRLSQGGEGHCVPKDSMCTFLELKAESSQDEHHFRDADGNEYLLRLRGLTRATGAAGSLSGQDVSALRGSPQVLDGSR